MIVEKTRFSDGRRLTDAGLLLIGVVTGIAAAAGLPLYGDGALYFVEILLDDAPLVPNGRYSAVLPQLPVLMALSATDQPTLLRHAFSFGYALLPFLSLLACWFTVRRTAPWLILYPTLFLVANQINFSAVSELLMGLYLVWPFLLLAALRPASGATLLFGAVLAPTLFFLHPLAFVLLLFLGWVGLIVKRSSGAEPRRWDWLAGAFLILGALRFIWSAIGSNAYERSHLSLPAAAGYLFPDRPSQTALLLGVLLVGLAVAARGWRSQGMDPGPAAGPGASCRGRWPWLRGCAARGWAALAPALWPVTGLTALVGLGVAAEIWVGEGVKLKSAVTFPLALALMLLGGFHARRPGRDRSGRGWAALFLLLTFTLAAMSLSKVAAWSRATLDLAAATAESAQGCVPFGPDQPPALQHPHMAALDNWTAPFNALVFRGPGPVALLLPGDGCQKLAQTGTAHLTSWFGRPLRALERRFGPLRQP